MLNIGDLLDNRYRIEGHLGQGGMAYVFKARDEYLERAVALKMLRPHLTDTDTERFRREIKTLARLSHPGVVSIYDLGRTEHVYFTMELVEGGLFTDLGPLENDPEPLMAMLSAAIAIAETLEYVHRLAIVHRDLTPRNILLTPQRYPKITDFGLVQLAETTRQLTRTGLTLGTPHYMAPEQATGEATGAHTDLYAFGAVLYRAVTGSAPFEAENDQAVLYQHVYGELIPAHELNPAVPPALSQLISRLLSKNPAERPSSGIQVAEKLRAILHLALSRASAMRLAGGAQQGVYVGGPVGTPLRKVWQRKLPSGPQWPAALTAAAGFLFVGLRSEEVQVIRPADGSIQAVFEAPDEVNTAPLFISDQLVMSSRDGRLSVLGWPSGTLRWSEALGVTGVAPLAETLLISRRDGGLERRTLDNQLVWRYQAESALLTPAICQLAQAFVISQEGWVHAVDLRSGAGTFKVHLGAAAAIPSARQGIVLLPERQAQQGVLHGFDIVKKEVIWTYDLDAPLWASPVNWRNYVYLAAWDQTVRCLSLFTGDDVWSAQVDAHITATPTIAAGVLYVATEGGAVYAFDALKGRCLWSDQLTQMAIQASPLIVEDKLIVAAIDGALAAYESA
jgi:serine/threonine-protein kinase